MATAPASHRDLLDGQLATLATVGPDGRPQLSTVWFLAAELVHPDIVWRQPGANHFSGTLNGRDAMFAMIRRMRALIDGTLHERGNLAGFRVGR